MSGSNNGNVSFDIDERARLFAFDIDRKGHVGLLPLFYDISTVLETINETTPKGGDEGLQTNEIHNEVYDDLRSVESTDLESLLNALVELDYLEQTARGNWKLKSSGSSGSGVDYL
ncbi:hypothetical protein [Halopiger xanaduensis]|uniref:Uncharacterized protein n=1 Tax=Halopiger xanaduensis (strain DSM 18323 / JCM 14033 / SH-6) TaxID=797210 RepID=F8DER3_HALXS|nr:hypothetical protein [Halopiger xanaduensis]AEH39502.1 hypothetical protein Halxa_0262 [Halopiger xanaduensis SH-6]